MQSRQLIEMLTDPRNKNSIEIIFAMRKLEHAIDDAYDLAK